MLTEASDFIEKGGEQEDEDPRRAALPHWLSLRLYGNGIRYRLPLANHAAQVLLDGTHFAQPRWIPAREISGRLVGHVASARPLPVASWCWIVSSMFLTGSPV